MANLATAVVDFYTTPFHINNRPDSGALLESSATAHSRFTINSLPKTTGATFRVAKDECTNADTASYVKVKYSGDVNTYYYVIADRQPLSMSSYQFTVVLDGFLTCKEKGITKIEGMTERVHIPKADDVLGAYVEDDPYLGCTEPLEVVEEELFNGSDYDGSSSRSILASTVDVYQCGDSTTREAIEFALTSGGSDPALVPALPALRSTDYGTDTLKQNVSFTYPSNNTPTGYEVNHVERCDIDYFSGRDSQVIEGTKLIHSLGQSDCIVAQYSVPTGFIDLTATDGLYHGRYAKIGSTVTLDLAGDCKRVSTSLNFEHSNSVQNKRLFVGDMNKYGITAVASGENAEFRPEDILKDSSGTNQTAPKVTMWADIREDGFPSYKFDYINKSRSLYRGVVKGLQWMNVPLINQSRAGYGMDLMKWKNNANVQDLGFEAQLGEIDLRGKVASIKNGVFGGLGIAQIATGSRAQGAKNLGGAFSDEASTIWNGALQTTIAQGYWDYARMQREQEGSLIVTSAMLTAPNMKFSFNPSLREIVGNGIVAYRYKPSNKDLARLDKILNMYGYKVTKPIESSDFSNRSRYNYIKASGVHITCDMPSYVVQMAENDIMAGLRIWHVAYDGNYTTANN